MANEKAKKSEERAATKTAKQLRERLDEVGKLSRGRFSIEIAGNPNEGTRVTVSIDSIKPAVWSTVEQSADDAIGALVHLLGNAAKFLECVELDDEGNLVPRGTASAPTTLEDC